ncbi:MAG: hypothetical protein JMM74_00580 [Candidatus Xiphinematobacter sp.]|nr:MAG: hypothetical protein JMM78_00600 [Candidatus Xiphinematobacter sp.]QQY10696.1 MAG: hypothetical protein JMM74_00580 [Candidatus Xiphinematobacter sp.]
MSEKISSDVRAFIFKDERYPLLFVRPELSEASYFQSLMEGQDGHPLRPYDKVAHLPSHRAGRAEIEKMWQRDGSSIVDRRSGLMEANESSEEEESNQEEHENNQCLLPFFFTGANGEFSLHPGLGCNEEVKDEEIKKVPIGTQHSLLGKLTLSATVDHACAGKGGVAEGSTNLFTEGINLAQCELQELVGKSVSRMEIHGAHSLSIQPRSDKLQETSIEIQGSLNGDFLVCIATSSEEALAVIQTHLATIHSRFLEAFPFRPLRLRIKYSENPPTEGFLQEKGEKGTPVFTGKRHDGAV